MPEVDEPHEDVRIHGTSVPVIGPGHTFGSVTDKISELVLRRRTPVYWFIGFALAFMLAQVLLITITVLVFKGIGIWSQCSGRLAFDIINFSGGRHRQPER